MKKTINKNDNFDNETYDDDIFYERKQIRTSRSKQKHQARRKIDSYMERKSLKNLFNDYTEIDMDDYLDDYSDMGVDDYRDDLEGVDFNSNSDYADHRI